MIQVWTDSSGTMRAKHGTPERDGDGVPIERLIEAYGVLQEIVDAAGSETAQRDETWLAMVLAPLIDRARDLVAR